MSTHRNMRMAVGAMVLAAGAGSAAAHPEVYADSLWEFSGVQGRWEYGFYDGSGPSPWTPADFERLPKYDEGAGEVWYRTLGPGGYWTAINAVAMHPNGLITSGGRLGEENWAVRRWTSDQQLPARLVGYVRDVSEADEGDGVTFKVFLDDREIVSCDIEDGDFEGCGFELPVCLTVGTTVDFVVTPRGLTDYCDATYYLIKVEGIIAMQPTDQYACDRRPVTLSVGIAGPGEYTYHWCKDGVPLEGETAATCTIESPRSADAGVYDCIISDGEGVVASQAAVLTVCEGDVNCDTFVDFLDYLEYLGRYDGGDAAADLDGDGFIDFVDYLEFLNIYNEGCAGGV